MKSLGAWIPKPLAIIDGTQVADHSALLALILLNPPLVLNHLVQYEGIEMQPQRAFVAPNHLPFPGLGHIRKDDTPISGGQLTM